MISILFLENIRYFHNFGNQRYFSCGGISLFNKQNNQKCINRSKLIGQVYFILFEYYCTPRGELKKNDVNQKQKLGTSLKIGNILECRTRINSLAKIMTSNHVNHPKLFKITQLQINYQLISIHFSLLRELIYLVIKVMMFLERSFLIG